jgi:RimJ/RimL family protein N-acetyltransferase
MDEESNVTYTDDCGRVVGFLVSNWSPPSVPPRTPMTGRYCDVVPLDVVRHANDLFQAFAHDGGEGNWSYLPYGPFADADGLTTWMQSACTGDDPLFHTIVDKQSNRPVGMASYLRITPLAGSIEVGHIHYSPLLQRTPAATEAMYLMMRRVFDLGYRRYEWKCNALNRASRDSALRFGFSFEGIFRQALVVKRRNRDTAWYACIDREWPALRAAYEHWLSPTNFDDAQRQRISLAELTRPILVNTG